TVGLGAAGHALFASLLTRRFGERLPQRLRFETGLPGFVRWRVPRVGAHRVGMLDAGVLPDPSVNLVAEVVLKRPRPLAARTLLSAPVLAFPIDRRTGAATAPHRSEQRDGRGRDHWKRRAGDRYALGARHGESP